MIDEKTNFNITKISKINEYEYYDDFIRYDPIFSEIKNGTFPYKMKLVCAKSYDYSQRMALILSAHGEYYLLDAYKVFINKVDKIGLMCNQYYKLNDAIDDMHILSSGFGGYDAYLVPGPDKNTSFELEFEGTIFMHGDDLMNGIFSPIFTIAAEVQKDPENSFILELSTGMFTSNGDIAFEDVEELKDKVLPLDEKIELNRKIPNQKIEKIKKFFGIKER